MQEVEESKKLVLTQRVTLSIDVNSKKITKLLIEIAKIILVLYMTFYAIDDFFAPAKR